MKLFAAALLGATITLAGPVLAQDRDGMSNRDVVSNMRDKPAIQHRVSRHHSYQWSYKSEQDEHQATEELNRQYRGVPRSDQR